MVDIKSFSLVNSEESYSPFLISDNTIHICIPNNTDITNLKPVISANITIKQIIGTQKDNNNEGFDFSDFINPVKLIVTDENNINAEVKIIIYDLPVLTITTPQGIDILSKDYRVENCELTLVTSSKKEYLGKAGLKLRGNSTAHQKKKPYNKLNEKKSILGMNKSKKWVLLANAYFDRTQLHNAIAFEIARLTDYKWVQEGTFVELIMNGTHKGLYYLCEKIDVEKKRINIEELKADEISEPEISGGYLIEASKYSETDPSYPILEEYTFITNYFNKTGLDFDFGLYWSLKNPDEDVPIEQLNYIKQCVNSMESLIYDDEKLLTGEWKEFLDIESVINYWFVEELCLNWEAAASKNLYMYKDRNDNKFYIGPPWDFDAWTFCFYETKRFYAKDTGFYYYQLFKDPYFVNRVKEKWQVYKTEWKEKIPIFIDEQYDYIHRSAERNEVLWPEWNDWNKFPDTTYEQLVLEMKNAFLEQLDWMDSEIDKM